MPTTSRVPIQELRAIYTHSISRATPKAPQRRTCTELSKWLSFCSAEQVPSAWVHAMGIGRNFTQLFAPSTLATSSHGAHVVSGHGYFP